MIEARWELKIGSTVTTIDGDYGHLNHLLLDPHQERIVGLVVRPQGWLPYHPVLVPENLIEDASENEVRLKISRSELEALPKYRPNSHLVLDSEAYEADDELFAVLGKQGPKVGRAPNSREPGMIETQMTGDESRRFGLRLRAGQQVFCRDEHAGWASLILLDPGGRVKGFVLHTGHLPLFGRELIVPVPWIQEVDHENIHLSVEKQELDRLPEYYSDEALGTAVDSALWSDRILRNTDYKQIAIAVQAGIVWLRGHVVTTTNKRNAEQAARSVPGVLGVENDLVVDDDLVFEVAQALGKHDLTRTKWIAVGARNGFITLNGEVSSASIRDAAEAIAASIPQVRGVVNYLHAPNVVIDYKEIPLWQPFIGHDISAVDMQLGRVEKVIIDPHNRRVAAFVARGYFPDPEDKDDYRLPSDEPRMERSVVIPMEAVNRVIDGYVLLGISGAEAARYRSLEPDGFLLPPTGWQPPYPYRWEQVLWDGQRLEEPRTKNGSL